MMNDMTVRQRFEAMMNFQPADRLPILEWAIWWDKTLDRWYGEGLPKAVRGHEALCRHFGLDLYLQDWIPPRRPGCPTPDQAYGPVIRHHEDYERIRPWLYPPTPIDPQRWQSWAAKQQRGQAVLWFTLEGFFWFPRWLLGVEEHLYMMFDQPDLIHRINDDLAQWMLRMIDQVAAIARPDFMTFAEDMSYNHGPMLSSQMFDQFMLPYYQRVIPRLHELGILAFIDSDGDVTAALPWWERAGLDGVLPLERQAGVDLAALRADHPRMRFIGHFDKMVMSRGRQAMAREFERLIPVARRGGYLISCDHQTPPEVSYAQYLEYLDLFRSFASAIATPTGK